MKSSKIVSLLKKYKLTSKAITLVLATALCTNMSAQIIFANPEGSGTAVEPPAPTEPAEPAPSEPAPSEPAAPTPTTPAPVGETKILVPLNNEVEQVFTMDDFGGYVDADKKVPVNPYIQTTLEDTTYGAGHQAPWTKADLEKVTEIHAYGDKGQEIKNIPENINLFTNLKEIQVSVPFEGEIPALTMPNLTILGINSSPNNDPKIDNVTKFPEITSTNLETLNFTNCNISGEIPDLSKFTKLTKLYLGYNQFTGNFPDVSKLTLLENLNLVQNKLDGEIPDLATNSTLIMIIISRNNFTYIPDFQNLPELKSLYIDGNDFDQTLPSFAKLTKLTNLNLENAGFKGKLPDLKTTINSPIYLYTNGNKFIGKVPDYASKLKNTSRFGGNYLNQAEVDALNVKVGDPQKPISFSGSEAVTLKVGESTPNFTKTLLINGEAYPEAFGEAVAVYTLDAEGKPVPVDEAQPVVEIQPDGTFKAVGVGQVKLLYLLHGYTPEEATADNSVEVTVKVTEKVIEKVNTKPVIEVRNNAISYAFGTARTADRFIGDAGATVTDAEDTVVPTIVASNFSAINFSQAGTYDVTLNSTDSKGLNADAVVVKVTINAEITFEKEPDDNVEAETFPDAKTGLSNIVTNLNDVNANDVIRNGNYNLVYNSTADNYTVFDDKGVPLAAVTVPSGSDPASVNIEDQLVALGVVSEPSVQDTTTGKQNPKTGNESNTALYIALGLATLGSCALLAARKRSK